MADYNVLQHHWNGSSYDNIYPITKSGNVTMTDGSDLETKLKNIEDSIESSESPINGSRLVDSSVAAEKLAEDYLTTNGGTMTGSITMAGMVLSSDMYGTSLPSSGVIGQIFFLKG